MPKKLTEFALLFSESLRDGFECASDGKGVLSVLRRKDALRRPERFAQLLRLLKEAHHIDSEKKWLMSARRSDLWTLDRFLQQRRINLEYRS